MENTRKQSVVVAMGYRFSKRLHWAKSLVTVYTTPRVVKIDSKILAITYLALMIIVWAAFLRSYQLDLRRIYQKSCPAKGIALLKVKGVISTEDYTDEELNITNPELYRRVWDNEDILMYYGDGFFVTTNVIITANQTRGRCPQGSPGFCSKNVECPFGTPNKEFNGVYDGICTSTGNCEVSAWCPVEGDTLPLREKVALLKDTKIMTVLIKSTVEFPECEKSDSKDEFKRRNILNDTKKEYLKECVYDPVKHPYCPIFNIGKIVEWSGADYDKVAIKGGVFRIVISWNCDFDWGRTIQECLPKYSFSRLDAYAGDISPGYNFRTASYNEENRRTLTKRYGLKFVIETAGEGKQFDFLLLVLTIGASIGLFALAPLVCDFMFDLFCFLKTLGGPCEKHFGSYSEEIRYQEINAHLSSTAQQSHNTANGGIEITEITTSRPL